MKFCHPVAQTIHDEPAHLGVIAVKCIAAAAEVVIIASGRLCIENIVINPFE